ALDKVSRRFRLPGQLVSGSQLPPGRTVQIPEFTQTVHRPHFGRAGHGQQVKAVSLKKISSPEIVSGRRPCGSCFTLITDPLFQDSGWQTIASFAGFEHKMAGVTGSPFVRIPGTRPIAKTAAGYLISFQTIKTCPDIAGDGGFLLLADIGQLFQHELGEHGRSDLLNAPVRITDQVVQPAREIDRRNGRYFKISFPRAWRSDGRKTDVYLFAGSNVFFYN